MPGWRGCPTRTWSGAQSVPGILVEESGAPSLNPELLEGRTTHGLFGAPNKLGRMRERILELL